MTWRVVLWFEDRTHRVVTVPGVAELRGVIARARACPEVVRYEYWRLLELAGEVRVACPECGGRYLPGQVGGRFCRCGLVHVAHACRACHTDLVDPPYQPGCGPIPFDADGVNSRYRR